MSPCSGKNIVVILTGSIACYKAASLISKLVQAGALVKTVTTRSALRFLGEATLEGLTGHKNLCDTFEAGEMMQHIHLARWADQIVVYPCTANFLSQWAHGLAPDLASNLILATEPGVPICFAPAMNTVMWNQPVTRQNLKVLEDRGAFLLPPGSGLLACGETGAGRVMEPEQAFACIENLWARKARVMVTYGGTVEPVDQVRGLTNFSSGRTGQVICEHLARSGFDVTAVRSRRAPRAHGVCQDLTFTDYQSLKTQLSTHLREQSFDGIVHLAAVSDFGVDRVVDSQGQSLEKSGKISSSEELTIHLKRHPKLLNQMKSWSLNEKIKVVGFKLTSNIDESATLKKVRSLFELGHVDLVVQNDLASVEKEHSYSIYDSNLKVVMTGQGKLALAGDLGDALQGPKSEEKNNRRNEVTL